jgi:hypothetical protein
MPQANALNSIGYTDAVLFLTIGKPDIYQLNPLYPTQHDRVSWKKRYIMQNINFIRLSLIGAASSYTQLLIFTRKSPA